MPKPSVAAEQIRSKHPQVWHSAISLKRATMQVPSTRDS